MHGTMPSPSHLLVRKANIRVPDYLEQTGPDGAWGVSSRRFGQPQALYLASHGIVIATYLPGHQLGLRVCVPCVPTPTPSHSQAAWALRENNKPGADHELAHR
jgi:hypothetical protein